MQISQSEDIIPLIALDNAQAQVEMELPADQFLKNICRILGHEEGELKVTEDAYTWTCPRCKQTIWSMSRKWEVEYKQYPPQEWYTTSDTVPYTTGSGNYYNGYWQNNITSSATTYTTTISSGYAYGNYVMVV